MQSKEVLGKINRDCAEFDICYDDFENFSRETFPKTKNIFTWVNFEEGTKSNIRRTTE